MLIIIVKHVDFSLFHQHVPWMTAPGVQKQEDEGQHGDDHHGEEHHEGNSLKFEIREVKFFGELFIELAKCFEMVIVLDEKCIKDDCSTLSIEKEQRDPVDSCHPLWHSCRNWHRHEEGD